MHCKVVYTKPNIPKAKPHIQRHVQTKQPILYDFTDMLYHIIDH